MNLKITIVSESQTKKRVHPIGFLLYLNSRKCKLIYNKRKQISGCLWMWS